MSNRNMWRDGAIPLSLSWTFLGALCLVASVAAFIIGKPTAGLVFLGGAALCVALHFGQNVLAKRAGSQN